MKEQVEKIAEMLKEVTGEMLANEMTRQSLAGLICQLFEPSVVIGNAKKRPDLVFPPEYYDKPKGEKPCPLCQGTQKILQRPARLIGATYPPEDTWKGDEHYEPCPLCSTEKPPVLSDEEIQKAIGQNHTFRWYYRNIVQAQRDADAAWFNTEYPIKYKEKADEVGDFIERGWTPPEQYKMNIQQAQQETDAISYTQGVLDGGKKAKAEVLDEIQAGAVSVAGLIEKAKEETAREIFEELLQLPLGRAQHSFGLDHYDECLRIRVNALKSKHLKG